MDQAQLSAHEIERIARLERTLARAYDIAMNKVGDPRLVEVLAPFRRRHDESAHVLQQVIAAQRSREPQLEEPFRAYLEEVLNTIGDAVRRDEALGELRLAEAGLKASYGQALTVATDAPAHVLERLMGEEAEHVRVLEMAHESMKT